MPERSWNRDTILLQEVYSAGLLVASLVNAELREGGIAPQLFSFLSWVRLLEPVTPGTLSAETGIPPTTIRDYLRRLSERGDIVRRPNPRDGRSYLVKLTPRGNRLVDRGRRSSVPCSVGSSPTCRVPQTSTRSGPGSFGRASQPWSQRTSGTDA